MVLLEVPGAVLTPWRDEVASVACLFAAVAQNRRLTPATGEARIRQGEPCISSEPSVHGTSIGRVAFSVLGWALREAVQPREQASKGQQ